jgi:23S rRNA C2498 (ribose-2'-O)-methylase RlmM
MNELKYTSDGKKVSVIGKINQTEFIVQEIFVTESGDEIPSGENFTAKSLHDKPVISWKEKRIYEYELKYKKIEELTCKLKEKEFEIQSHVEKWQFYEQIVRNLTTFKR